MGLRARGRPNSAGAPSWQLRSLGELRGLFRAAGVLLPLHHNDNGVVTGRSRTNVIANRALPFDEHGMVHDVIANEDLLRAHQMVEDRIADAYNHMRLETYCRTFCP